MQGVRAVPGLWQRSYRISNRARSRRLACKRNSLAAAGQQNEPSPSVGNAEPRHVLHAPGYVVAKLGKAVAQLPKRLSPHQTRHVFHHDGLRVKGSREAQHLADQIIPSVPVASRTVACAKIGEALTRR